MEIAASVGTSLADRAATAVVDGTLQQFRYVLDYRDNMTNLRDNLRDLRASKARVTHMVDQATRVLEEIEDDVLTWITRADEAILRVDNILTDDDMANKTCCAGRLPDFKNRYKLSKRAKLEAPALPELTERGNRFERVGYRLPLHHQVLPSDDFEAFGSRELTLNSIMEALRDRCADLIGVWGLGGVGKTTLAKEVGQRMKAEGVFQLVVTAEVHPKADVKAIQERVAEWVEIKKEVQSLDSIELRAALLHKRLLQEKSVLVILDDVWDAIDLKKVGIPIGGDMNRCTVLVTTRHESLVSQMAVQKQKRFWLNVLRDDEALELFQKMVGDIPEDDLVPHNVATQIVKRCGGLPILVLPVATALKGKPLSIWEDALDRLDSGLLKNGDNMQSLAYSALELSCNHLGADQKSLFLFCGLLEPSDIDIGDIVKYMVGLSLFKDCLTVKATRSRVLKLLGDLTSSCLLLKGDNNDSLTMHDIVHNFVRGYSDQVFSPADYSMFVGWPDKRALAQLTDISLRYCQSPNLPTRLECPKLQIFLFYQLPGTLDDGFFDALEELRVLDLTEACLSPHPSSLRRLRNLQTLCLDHCIVEDIGVIGNMIQLKILSLMGTNIVYLPEEIGKLARLQLLDLRRCMELKKISPGILSSLAHLEELYMGDSFTQWGLRDKSDGQQINADLAELKKLEKLTTLEIGITNVTSLPDNLFSDKLERFFIVIGDCWDWSRNDGVSATLKVKLDANIRVLKKVNMLLKKVDDLHLDNAVGVKDADLPELNMEGFGNRLKNLQLQNFHEVRYLVNSVQRGPYIAFPRLEALVIDNAQHLEKICNGPLKKESLENLKQIKISSCDELCNIFPLSVARYLSKLEDIEVTYCEKLEGIFVVDNKANDKDEKICLSCLRKLTLDHLPSLDNILVIHETREDAVASDSQHNRSTLPLTFFSEKMVFPNIEHLKVVSIKIRKMWNSGLPNFDSCIRNIVTLKIDGCKFIKDIFTDSMVNSLVQLQSLEIQNCQLLQEIIVREKYGEEKKICLPKLESLTLRQLDLLVRVCTSDLFECPNLKDLWIEDCRQLKTFIKSSSHQPSDQSLFDNKVVFPNLERLTVSNMDSLIMLWDEELHEDSFSKLKYLFVEKAIRLTKLFSSSFMIKKIHTLETLRMGECDSLEEVFDLHGLINEKGKYPNERISMLTYMKVWSLPNLKHVWRGDPHGILSFQNLRILNVWNCSSLDGFLAASIAQHLPRFEELWLGNCESLEQIIYNEEPHQQEVYPTFVFSALQRIMLWDAPRLSSFYPGQHVIDWPAVKRVAIVRCPLLEVFKSELDKPSHVPKERLLGGHQSSLSRPLFSFEQDFTKLESVSLSNQQLQMIQKLELSGVLSSTLKAVEFYSFCGESAKFPINFLERFPNLEKLEVARSDFVELFTYEILDEEKETLPLSRIQHLFLHDLDKLEHIWNPQSKLGRILNNLTYVQLDACKSLIHLATPYASFGNLTTISVINCQSLVSLFTFSTMSSLVQLREMTVSDCGKLTEVAATSDEVIDGEGSICFYKLEILRLSKLGSIISFCPQNNSILKFPLLVQLIVEDCPHMEFFSRGYLSAPKLKKVELKWAEDNDNTRWKGELNTTIRQLYADKRLAEEETNTMQEEEALESSQP